MSESRRPGSMELACEYERNFESMRWVTELPAFSFPSDWMVKIIPGYVGAVIRFHVWRKGQPEKIVSVYFDGYNNLGIMEKPYWEIYPLKDDTARYFLGEEDEMLQGIEEALKELEKSDE